ncbi:MAG: hypothetical protein QM655_08005 [Nocardioidaceae bacterium]
MSDFKVRKTITLDPDLVAEFGDEGTALSANINAALRQVKDQRTAQALFDAYVADLLETFGAPDAEAVARFDALFDEAAAEAHEGVRTWAKTREKITGPSR